MAHTRQQRSAQLVSSGYRICARGLSRELFAANNACEIARYHGDQTSVTSRQCRALETQLNRAICARNNGVHFLFMANFFGNMKVFRGAFGGSCAPGGKNVTVFIQQLCSTTIKSLPHLAHHGILRRRIRAAIQGGAGKHREKLGITRSNSRVRTLNLGAAHEDADGQRNSHHDYGDDGVSGVSNIEGMDRLGEEPVDR